MPIFSLKKKFSLFFRINHSNSSGHCHRFQDMMTESDIQFTLKSVDDKIAPMKQLGTFMKKSFGNREDAANLLLSIGLFFPFFLALMLLASTLSFAISIPITPYHFVFSLVISIVLYFGLLIRYISALSRRKAGFLSLLILVVILISVVLAGYFYDLSYDGRLYHQFSVSHMATGWNPFYSPYQMTGHHPYYGQMKKSVWCSIYPRAMETCAANIYALTGRVEQGKAINLMMIFSAFCIVFASLLIVSQLSSKLALLISFLLAMNPVSVTTMFSYYVDGFLGTVVVSLFALTLIGFRKKKFIYFTAMAPYILILINIKFTGLAYAFFICLGIMIGLLIKKQPIPFMKTGLLFLLSGIVGFILIGYSPYITNFKKYGHPLHPVMGKKKMKGLMKRRFLAIPKNLQSKNRFEKFFISILSRSDFIQYPHSTELKLPFSVKRQEILNFKSTHVRIGGWGPIYGGILLLLLFIFPIHLYLSRGRLIDYLWLLALILLSIIVNREFWYARFAPQVWFIPFVLVTALLQENSGIFKRIGQVLLVLLLVNALMVYWGYFSYQVPASAKLHAQLKKIAFKNRTVELNPGIFKSARMMFYEAGIRFKVVDRISKYRKKRQLGHSIEVGL